MARLIRLSYMEGALRDATLLVLRACLSDLSDDEIEDLADKIVASCLRNIII